MSDIKRPGLLDDPAPRLASRPSLIGSTVLPATATEAVSILSAVAADEPRAAPVKGPVRSGMAAALPWLGITMLAFIAMAFWLEWRSTRPPPAPAVVTAPVAPAVKPPTVVVAAPAAEPEQVAKIEIEPLQQQPAQAPVVTAPVAATAPAALTTARPKSPKPVVPATKTTAAQRSPFAAMETPESPTARKTRPTGPANTGNRDVDLLAALLSHGTAVPPTASNSPRSKFSTKLSNMEPSLSTDKREPSPSTRERLSLCNQMASRDMPACKAKVCKGLWGQDAACPAGSEPPVRGKQD